MELLQIVVKYLQYSHKWSKYMNVSELLDNRFFMSL